MDTVPTTLAFVHTLAEGEREFSFYRQPGADMTLTKEDVMTDIIESSRIFHFGTLSSTHPGVREATRFAVEFAKEKGLLISFDPNLRESLWESLDDAKREIEYGLSKCDILKISDNELEFMTDTRDYDEGIRRIREKYDIPLIFLTLGKDGSRAYYKDIRVERPAYQGVNAVEKTGAGDTFEGCALDFVLEYGIDGFDESKLSELLDFANAGAAIITTRKGALKVMPDKMEIARILDKK